MPGGHVVGIPEGVGLVAEIEAEAGIEGATRRDVVYDEIHLVQADRCHSDHRSVRRGDRAAECGTGGRSAQPPKPPPPAPTVRP